MSTRSAAVAVGAGIAVFLVVAGAAVAVVVAARDAAITPPARYAVDAAAGFRFAVVALLAVSYVNLAGLRSELSTDVTVGVAVLVAALAALASWRTTR